MTIQNWLFHFENSNTSVSSAALGITGFYSWKNGQQPSKFKEKRKISCVSHVSLERSWQIWGLFTCNVTSHRWRRWVRPNPAGTLDLLTKTRQTLQQRVQFPLTTDFELREVRGQINYNVYWFIQQPLGSVARGSIDHVYFIKMRKMCLNP